MSPQERPRELCFGQMDTDTSKLVLVRTRPDGAKVWSDPNDPRLIIVTDIAFLRGRGGRPRKEASAGKNAKAVGLSKVATVLAQAHQIVTDVAGGKAKSYADVARSMGISRTRVTQLVKLTCLAPEIQEQIANMKSVHGERLTERMLRPIAADADPNKQLEMWREVLARLEASAAGAEA